MRARGGTDTKFLYLKVFLFATLVQLELAIGVSHLVIVLRWSPKCKIFAPAAQFLDFLPRDPSENWRGRIPNDLA